MYTELLCACMQIAGAVGERAAHVNGLYLATDQTFGRRVVYKKDDADVWIEYHADKAKWVVKRSQTRGKFAGYLRSHIACLSHSVEHVLRWDIFDKSLDQWRLSDTILVLRAQPVVIDRLSGSCAEHVKLVHFEPACVPRKACVPR